MIRYCEQEQDPRGQVEIEESMHYLINIAMPNNGLEGSLYDPSCSTRINFSDSEFFQDPPIRDLAQCMSNFSGLGEYTLSDLYEQMNSQMIDEGSQLFQEPQMSEHVTSQISRINQNKPKSQRIRDKNQNICKKYNTIACRILQKNGCQRQMKIIKKLVHRIDFFIITMMIAEAKGKKNKFNDDYRKQATKMISGFQEEKLQEKNYQVQKGQKTLKSLDAYERANFQQSIAALFDDEKTKNKEPKDRSLKMLKELKNKISANNSSMKQILAQFMLAYDKEKKVKR